MLSLEEATRIAKERIKKDGFPEDHLVIHFVDQPQFKDKFYAVWFDPHIPDPTSKKEGTFIGYNIMMDGVVEKTVITETRSRVRVPAKVTEFSERVFDAKRVTSSGLLDKPFTLRLDTGKTNVGAYP